jgi:hypothetical protein
MTEEIQRRREKLFKFGAYTQPVVIVVRDVEGLSGVFVAVDNTPWKVTSAVNGVDMF